MKFHIYFKWHNDEAYEAMNDKALDETAKELVMNLKTESITCNAVRDLHRYLARRNEALSDEKLIQFMKEDYEGIPRYVRYVQEIVEHGIYIFNPDLDPSETDEFISSVEITSEDCGLDVEFVIPEKFYIEDWGRRDYLNRILSFQNSLADSLWEGSPGSVAVHDSCAVVGYRAW